MTVKSQMDLGGAAGLVSEWMSRRVVSVKLRDTLLKARQLLSRHEINQLPVLKDGMLVGIVTDRDIRDAYPPSLTVYTGASIDRYARSHFVEEAMIHQVITASPEMTIAEAASLLLQNRIGGLPVMSEGKIVGILSRSDVMRAVIDKYRGSVSGQPARGGEPKEKRLERQRR